MQDPAADWKGPGEQAWWAPAGGIEEVVALLEADDSRDAPRWLKQEASALLGRRRQPRPADRSARR